MQLYLLSFPGISPSAQHKEKNWLFCLCCVIVSEGFDIPAVRDSLERRSW